MDNAVTPHHAPLMRSRGEIATLLKGSSTQEGQTYWDYQVHSWTHEGSDQGNMEEVQKLLKTGIFHSQRHVLFDTGFGDSEPPPRPQPRSGEAFSQVFVSGKHTGPGELWQEGGQAGQGDQERRLCQRSHRRHQCSFNVSTEIQMRWTAPLPRLNS